MGSHDQGAGRYAELMICGQTAEQVVSGTNSFFLRHSRQSCTGYCWTIGIVYGPQEACARQTHHRRAYRFTNNLAIIVRLVKSAGI
jgi:hypothetical protein